MATAAPTTHQCTDCRRVLPETADFWHMARGTTKRSRGTCKECHRMATKRAQKRRCAAGGVNPPSHLESWRVALQTIPIDVVRLLLVSRRSSTTAGEPAGVLAVPVGLSLTAGGLDGADGVEPPDVILDSTTGLASQSAPSPLRNGAQPTANTSDTTACMPSASVALGLEVCTQPSRLAFSV